jgi:molybdenum ABC transporter molybdate-binding protein
VIERPSRRSFVLAGTTGAALLAPRPSAAAAARDLVIYAEPTLRPVIRTLGQLWRSKSGVRVNAFVARSELHFAQIERGARCDLIFALTGDSLDEATDNKLVKSSASVFRNSLVLASHDMPTGPSTDVPLLLAGKRLAIADPERDVAGSSGVTALQAAGVVVDPEGGAVAVAESSAGVLRMLSDKVAQFGVVFLSDAAPRMEFKAMSLDPASHPEIEYAVGEAVNAQSDTRPFVEFLKTDEATSAIKAAGLQPISN